MNEINKYESAINFPVYVKLKNGNYFSIFEDGRYIRTHREYIDNELETVAVIFGKHFERKSDNFPLYVKRMIDTNESVTEDDFNKEIGLIDEDFKQFHEQWIDDVIDRNHENEEIINNQNKDQEGEQTKIPF